MRRLGYRALLLPLFALLTAHCATYRQDLARAHEHYDSHRFEQALALFRVLEPDLDSLSPSERTQFAYLRGMTDFRLSALATEGSAMNDPKRDFRANSRHWLALAAAMEKETPGGITGDEKKRLEETLADLNRDVYGGVDDASKMEGEDASPPASGDEKDEAPAADKAAPAKPSENGK